MGVPPDPTGALPLDPTGEIHLPDPLFCLPNLDTVSYSQEFDRAPSKSVASG